jgi:hypothetical protein
MEFRIVRTSGGNTQFIEGNITITVAHFTYDNGKHKITEPPTASAQFMCKNKLYIVTNSDNIGTVEDCYLGELLPKLQMMDLLTAPISL